MCRRMLGLCSWTFAKDIIKFQWGRRLEGWPNTAARLAGWGRVTLQVWFCTLYGRAIPPAFTVLYVQCTSCPDRSCPAACWWNFQLMLYSKCTVHSYPSWASAHKEGMAWYSIVDRCLLSDLIYSRLPDLIHTRPDHIHLIMWMRCGYSFFIPSQEKYKKSVTGVNSKPSKFTMIWV